MSPQPTPAPSSAFLRIFSADPTRDGPETSSSGVHVFHVNGWPATLEIWTAEQWGRLEERPAEALEFDGGQWAAFRMQ